MSEADDNKQGWFRAVAKAPADVIAGGLERTVRFKRLFSLSSQAVDTRAKLDDMQKAAAAQQRQVGDARQGIVETERALASLSDELSGLTRDFSELGKSR